MTEQEALHIVRNPWGHSAHEQHEAALRLADGVELLAQELDEAKRKLDAAERRIVELEQWEPDLSLYGKGEPKSLEELKASHDRLVGGTAEDFKRFDPALGAPLPACTCPRDSTWIEKSCPVHGGWFPQGECTCPPEWTAQCQSSACPRHRTKNTRDWL